VIGSEAWPAWGNIQVSGYLVGNYKMEVGKVTPPHPTPPHVGPTAATWKVSVAKQAGYNGLAWRRTSVEESIS